MTLESVAQELPAFFGHKANFREDQGVRSVRLGPFFLVELPCGGCWSLAGPRGFDDADIVTFKVTKSLHLALSCLAGSFVSWLMYQQFEQ